ncbi:MAG: AsmA family protein [Magnetococcales bacterium]|nr:AsmA family protein [Magnetococcales bacterium]
MAKPIKFILFFILFAVLAAVAGVGGLLLWLDPNAHKAQIAQLVEAQTGRHLTIREDFSLAFFPWFGVHLGAMELSNAPGFGAEPLARIASAQLRVKLLPLWQQKIELDIITLQGLRLNLEKNRAGATNWADLARSSRATPVAPEGKGSPVASQTEQAPTDTVRPADPAPPLPPWLAGMDVGGLQVVDAEITLRDAAPDRIRTIKMADLTTGPLREGLPVPLALELRLEESGATSRTVALRLQGDLLANANGLTLSAIQAHLDESELLGQFSIQDFSHPVVRWDLALDMLDLDRYRSPTVGTPKKGESAPAGRQDTAPTATPATSPTPPIVQEKPGGGAVAASWRSMDAKGRLRIAKGQVAHLAMQDIDLTVQGKEGVWHLSPAKASLYQGTLAVEATLHDQETAPQLTVEGHLEGVQMGPLLRDLHSHATLTGLATLQTRLTTVCDNTEQAKKNMQGTARWSVKEGTLQGVDIPGLLGDAYQVVQGKPTHPQADAPATAFASLDGSATISHGMVDNRDLALVSSLVRIRGEGTVNLPTEQVDYRLNTTVVAAVPGAGGEAITGLAGLTIPMQVTGSLHHPAWKLDLKTLLEQDMAQKSKEKLGTKLQDKLSEVLKKKGLDKVLPADAGKRLLDALPFR